MVDRRERTHARAADGAIGKGTVEDGNQAGSRIATRRSIAVRRSSGETPGLAAIARVTAIAAAAEQDRQAAARSCTAKLGLLASIA